MNLKEAMGIANIWNTEEPSDESKRLAIKCLGENVEIISHERDKFLKRMNEAEQTLFRYGFRDDFGYWSPPKNEISEGIDKLKELMDEAIEELKKAMENAKV